MEEDTLYRLRHLAPVHQHALNFIIFHGIFNHQLINQRNILEQSCAGMTDPAVERIQKSDIAELVITNTIPLPAEKAIDKIKVLSVAPLLGEAIMRIFHQVSVSKLFEK